MTNVFGGGYEPGQYVAIRAPKMQFGAPVSARFWLVKIVERVDDQQIYKVQYLDSPTEFGTYVQHTSFDTIPFASCFCKVTLSKNLRVTQKSQQDIENSIAYNLSLPQRAPKPRKKRSDTGKKKGPRPKKPSLNDDDEDEEMKADDQREESSDDTNDQHRETQLLKPRKKRSDAGVKKGPRKKKQGADEEYLEAKRQDKKSKRSSRK